MKFSNSYNATFVTGAEVSNNFFEKVVGIFKKDSNKANAQDNSNGFYVKAVITGETSCEVSVEELKELFDENNKSMEQLHDWVKNGKLKTVCDGLVKTLADCMKLGAKEGKEIAKEIMSDED